MEGVFISDGLNKNTADILDVQNKISMLQDEALSLQIKLDTLLSERKEKYDKEIFKERGGV